MYNLIIILGKQFACENCGRSYTHYTTLVRHIDLECGKEPSLECNKCGYRTYRKYSLMRHSKIHQKL